MRIRSTAALGITLALLIAPRPSWGEAAVEEVSKSADESAEEAPETAPKGDEEPSETAPKDGEKPSANSESKTVDPDQLRVQLERGISEIGEIAADVREEADPRKVACVVDKQERAEIVMERATADILVIEDSKDAQARVFAGEKLSASAERMGKLVELARRCQGVEEGGRPESDTTNTANEPSKVPQNDPTKDTPGNQPFPLPQDPGRGPVSSAVR